ncbi:MAG: GNAT family N-acetyltransferase [Candidatus Hodarchaeales archaeon]
MPNKSEIIPKLKIRRFRNSLDYKIITTIRNKSAQEHYGNNTEFLDTEQIRNLVASPDRVRIAEADGKPIGFIFVVKKDTIQLDEYGTIEGRSWLILGPTVLLEYESTGAGVMLLNQLIAYAKEKDILNTIRIVRVKKMLDHLRTILINEGFHLEQKYYTLKLHLKNSPSLTRKVPLGMELIDYKGEEDFDKLWSILRLAFNYRKNAEEQYEDTKNLFNSLKLIYMPICIDSQSQQAIGTISVVSQKTLSGINAFIATFGVIPAFQGRGIGSMLMEKAIHHCWINKITSIQLVVRVKNPQALLVYKKFHFQILPEHTTLVFIKDI